MIQSTVKWRVKELLVGSVPLLPLRSFISIFLDSGDDSDQDNVLAGNDEMEREEDEAANRRFLSQMAKSEKGEAR